MIIQSLTFCGSIRTFDMPLVTYPYLVNGKINSSKIEVTFILESSQGVYEKRNTWESDTTENWVAVLINIQLMKCSIKVSNCYTESKCSTGIQYIFIEVYQLSRMPFSDWLSYSLSILLRIVRRPLLCGFYVSVKRI